VALIVPSARGGVRKVLPGNYVPPAETLDQQGSAGVFVGVRDFEDETLTPVRYAVDDAVDLAYELSIAHKPPLLDPKRVALVLSGEPQKPQSQQSLVRLKEAGASQTYAQQSTILKLLRSQSQSVGRNGILFIAFATHGISDAGTQYLLVANS